jgi:hypothetical protein
MKMVLQTGADSSSSAQGQVAGTCDEGDDHSGLQSDETIDFLTGYQLFKK